jgi:hypothetical protein
VDQEVPIIHEDPLGIFVALDADWQFADLFQFLINLVAGGVPLAGVGDGADDEEISEGRYISKVEDPQVGGFFGFSGFGRKEPIRLFVGRLRFSGMISGEAGQTVSTVPPGPSVLHRRRMRPGSVPRREFCCETRQTTRPVRTTRAFRRQRSAGSRLRRVVGGANSFSVKVAYASGSVSSSAYLTTTSARKWPLTNSMDSRAPPFCSKSVNSCT